MKSAHQMKNQKAVALFWFVHSKLIILGSRNLSTFFCFSIFWNSTYWSNSSRVVSCWKTRNHTFYNFLTKYEYPLRDTYKHISMRLPWQLICPSQQLFVLPATWSQANFYVNTLLFISSLSSYFNSINGLLTRLTADIISPSDEDCLLPGDCTAWKSS